MKYRSHVYIIIAATADTNNFSIKLKKNLIMYKTESCER